MKNKNAYLLALATTFAGCATVQGPLAVTGEEYQDKNLKNETSVSNITLTMNANTVTGESDGARIPGSNRAVTVSSVNPMQVVCVGKELEKGFKTTQFTLSAGPTNDFNVVNKLGGEVIDSAERTLTYKKPDGQFSAPQNVPVWTRCTVL